MALKASREPLCHKIWFLAKVRETGWFGGFAMFSRTRVGRRGRAIIEEKPPNSPRPGCHPYGLTNLGQEPLSDKSQPGMPGRARSARRRRHRETPQVDKCAGAAPVTKTQQRAC